MKHSPKLIRFYIISIFSLAFAIVTACEEASENPVPDVPVYIGPIDIYDPSYIDLLDVYGTHIFKNEGYQNNGVMLVNVGNGVYKAYDCTCTHEVKAGCIVLPTQGKINHATCSCCASTFDLNFGSPLSGKATFILKEYKVNFSNNTIYIYY